MLGKMSLLGGKFSQLIRFVMVGGGVMALFMGLNALLGLWFSSQVAFLLAYPPALGVHFSLNKWWTFGCHRQDTSRQLGEYLVMVAVTFVVQWAVFSALTWLTSWPGWLAAGIANVAQMAISFLGMQRRIFAGTAAARG